MRELRDANSGHSNGAAAGQNDRLVDGRFGMMVREPLEYPQEGRNEGERLPVDVSAPATMAALVGW
jgi:hypothetical protein